MKTAHDIILKPVITEASMQGIANKKYTFQVAKDANKIEIAKAVAELFADFWKDWCDEAEFFDGFYLCIRKLPWIYKALQLVNEGIISKESNEVIRDEIDWLVDRCFCYQGQHGIYCLECTLTVEDAYVHYPNLFTPLRLTILESVAEKLCKSAESFTKLSADGKEKNAKTKNAKGSE